MTTATLPTAEQATAACYGIPTDMFYPAPEDQVGFRAAKRICRGCPLMDACRDFAVANHEEGVWGATSERQRETIRRRQHPETIRGSWARTAADRRRVARLAATGLRVAQISADLDLSTRTVGRHLRALREAA